MATTICPHCNAAGRVPDTVVGRRVKCPKCQQPFTVVPAPEPSATKPHKPAPAPGGPRKDVPKSASISPARRPPPVQEDILEEIDDDVPVVSKKGAKRKAVVAAEVADEAGPPIGGMRYFRPLQYFRENPKWFTNILLSGLCNAIPIIGPMVQLGYDFEVMDDLRRQGDTSYPDFDFGRFTPYLKRGLFPALMMILAGFIVGVVYVVLSIVVNIVSRSLPGAVLVLLFLGMQFLLLLVLFLGLPPLVLYGGIRRSFDVGGGVRFAQLFLGKVLKEYLLGSVVLALLNFVLLLCGCLVCGVGLIPAAGAMGLIYTHMYYQLYQLYLERGGEPIRVPATETV